MAWLQVIWSAVFPAEFCVTVIPWVQSWPPFCVCELPHEFFLWLCFPQWQDHVSRSCIMIHCLNQLWTLGMRVTPNSARNTVDQIKSSDQMAKRKLWVYSWICQTDYYEHQMVYIQTVNQCSCFDIAILSGTLQSSNRWVPLIVIQFVY